MAAESINEIVSDKAIEQLLNLGKELDETGKEMGRLIELVAKLNQELGKA